MKCDAFDCQKQATSRFVQTSGAAELTGKPILHLCESHFPLFKRLREESEKQREAALRAGNTVR